MPFNFYNDEDNEKTIFIPIAACDEYFLEHTVKGALALAYKPERIFFGIYNTVIDNKKTLLNNEFFTKHPNIFYVEVNSPSPLGTGFSRMSASLLSTRPHDYVFQIDAHIILSKNWDKELIDCFKKIEYEEGTNKIFLTALAGVSWTYNKYKRENIFAVNKKIENFSINSFYDNDFDQDPNLINARPGIRFDGKHDKVFSEYTYNMPMTGDCFEWSKPSYEEVNCIYAAMMFSKYSTIREIMHDPEDPWHGDQVNYGIRVLSRNYKIFAIQKPFFMLLGKVVVKDNQHIEIDPEYSWRSIDKWSKHEYKDNKDKTAIENYKNIIDGKYLGYWGAPDEESLIMAKKKIGFNISDTK